MAAYEPTNLQVNAPNPTVGVSLLAMAAWQPTSLLQMYSIPVGAGLPAMAASHPPQNRQPIPPISLHFTGACRVVGYKE